MVRHSAGCLARSTPAGSRLTWPCIDWSSSIMRTKWGVRSGSGHSWICWMPCGPEALPPACRSRPTRPPRPRSILGWPRGWPRVCSSWHPLLRRRQLPEAPTHHAGRLRSSAWWRPWRCTWNARSLICSARHAAAPSQTLAAWRCTSPAWPRGEATTPSGRPAAAGTTRPCCTPCGSSNAGWPAMPRMPRRSAASLIGFPDSGCVQSLSAARHLAGHSRGDATVGHASTVPLRRIAPDGAVIEHHVHRTPTKRQGRYRQRSDSEPHTLSTGEASGRSRLFPLNLWPKRRCCRAVRGCRVRSRTGALLVLDPFCFLVY